jgi:hypothetical protein
MPFPPENNNPHNTKERANGIYECTRCGKMSTEPSKLEMTACVEQDSS